MNADAALADKTRMTLPLQSSGCRACKDGAAPLFPFSMAFQPIVDTMSGQVFAYEALVRGIEGQSAGWVLAQVTDENRYTFDQMCRVKAINLAAKLGLADTGARLSINFMPRAVYSPAACLQLTLRTAEQTGFPIEKLIFEIVESEEVLDCAHLASIVNEYRRRGLQVALDDFGAGSSGLSLLASLPTDIIKLDMELTRNLPRRASAIAIVKMMVELAKTLGCVLVAEGIETLEEYTKLRSCGITLMQGYLFAKPAFEALPPISLPVLGSMDLPVPESGELLGARALSMPLRHAPALYSGQTVPNRSGNPGGAQLT